MDELPLGFIVADRPCLVVGGGPVAARKCVLLKQAGAKITIIAPTLCAQLKSAVERGEMVWHAADFHPDQLRPPPILIFSATDSQEINQAVFAAATAARIPINVVDQPQLCTFYMPAIVDRSPIVIAIGSGGASPVLTRLLREKIEALLPAHYGRLARWAGSLRQKVHQLLPSVHERRRLWEEVFDGPIAEQVMLGNEEKATTQLLGILQQPGPWALPRGEVYLVGAGPGDADLLTLRALHLMQRAEVVLYDALVSPQVLELVRREAERVFVGKTGNLGNQHVLPQQDINERLVKLALSGKRVLRLKGGDPYIFGRGGEEIGALMDHNIPFQVVPGISAANGVASYAGIPLTHRDYAQSVIFTTGHLKDDQFDMDWPALVRPRQTVVIYMGIGALARICGELIAHGLPGTHPVAVVQQGTFREQRVVRGTLADLPHKAVGIQPPGLIIVGAVVALRDRLRWFSDRE